MRALIVHVLSVIGLWSCQKAIDMADHGHIDFEVDILPKQPIIFYHKKPNKCKLNLKLMVLIFVGIGLVIWSVLTLAYSINDAGHKITEELKKEHKEEMKIKCIPNKIFRHFVSFD